MTLQVAILIRLSQDYDLISFSARVELLPDYVKVLQQISSSPEATSSYLSRTLSLENLVIDKDALIPIILSVCKIAITKYDKHSGKALQFLRAAATLSPNFWRCGRSLAAIPTEMQFLFLTSREMISNVTMEWQSIARSATMSAISKETILPTVNLRDALKLWQQVCTESHAPTFMAGVERVLSVRQGIADVERMFSKLRCLDETRRNRTSDETLEGEFWIAANSDFCDEFSNKN